MNDVIEIRQDGSVLTMALNRPQSHNAFSPQMSAAVRGAFVEIAVRDDVAGGGVDGQRPFLLRWW